MKTIALFWSSSLSACLSVPICLWTNRLPKNVCLDPSQYIYTRNFCKRLACESHWPNYQSILSDQLLDTINVLPHGFGPRLARWWNHNKCRLSWVLLLGNVRLLLSPWKFFCLIERTSDDWQSHQGFPQAHLIGQNSAAGFLWLCAPLAIENMLVTVAKINTDFNSIQGQWWLSQWLIFVCIVIFPKTMFQCLSMFSLGDKPDCLFLMSDTNCQLMALDD